MIQKKYNFKGVPPITAKSYVKPPPSLMQRAKAKGKAAINSISKLAPGKDAAANALGGLSGNVVSAKKNRKKQLESLAKY